MKNFSHLIQLFLEMWFGLANLANEHVEDQFQCVVKGSILDFLYHRQEQLAYAPFISVEPAHVGKHHILGENQRDMGGNLVIIQSLVAFFKSELILTVSKKLLYTIYFRIIQ